MKSQSPSGTEQQKGHLLSLVSRNEPFLGYFKLWLLTHFQSSYCRGVLKHDRKSDWLKIPDPAMGTWLNSQYLQEICCQIHSLLGNSSFWKLLFHEIYLILWFSLLKNPNMTNPDYFTAFRHNEKEETILYQNLQELPQGWISWVNYLRVRWNDFKVVLERVFSEQMLLFHLFYGQNRKLMVQSGILTWLSFATHFSEMFSVLWGSAFLSWDRREIKTGWGEHAHGKIRFDVSAALLTARRIPHSCRSGSGWTLIPM